MLTTIPTARDGLTEHRGLPSTQLFPGSLLSAAARKCKKKTVAAINYKFDTTINRIEAGMSGHTAETLTGSFRKRG
jgi:hypothetical protein